jgi:hypothetical protein
VAEGREASGGLNQGVGDAAAPGGEAARCAHDSAPLAREAKRRGGWPLVLVAALFVVLSIVGLDWGLPSRSSDAFLFGEAEPWSAEGILELAGERDIFSAERGADVDVDPLARAEAGDYVELTGTPSKVADIYLRYRLYTNQPDELITIRALGGMRPSEGKLDPRLYQYGGLFLYPVGALLKAASLAGWVELCPDVAFYLDHPEAMGRFYIVSRAYAAGWGVLGVCVVFAIGRRLAGRRAGLLAAMLYALLPVVVCMSHEGKPHLPGAVLMLAAVWLAMRQLSGAAAEERGAAKDAAESSSKSAQSAFARGSHTNSLNWWLMCIACGAAFGMVLSSWPIFVLVPLVALLEGLRRIGQQGGGVVRTALRAAGRTTLGVCVGWFVYLLVNPYLVINYFTNRAVLESNFGNSLAMYQVDRIYAGLVRVMQLTVEGTTALVAFVGLVGLVWALRRKAHAALVLAVPAFVFFVQFVLIGAGKPAEYGRFGIFTNTALAIGAAVLVVYVSRGGVARRWRSLGAGVIAIASLLAAGLGGGQYLYSFWRDATPLNTRMEHAAWIAEVDPSVPIGLLAEPAPYSCPPLCFAERRVLLFRDLDALLAYGRQHDLLVIRAVDSAAQADGPLGAEHLVHDPAWRGSDTLNHWETPISWANKPFVVGRMAHSESEPAHP